MSQAVVGALRVTLGLDSAQFKDGMKEAQTGLQRFAGVAKAGALAIGTAMVAAGGAIAVAMKGVIDRAGDMYELSQSLGMTVEDLSRMAYAAELSGVQIDGLEKAIKKLSVSLFDASQSGTGPAANAFRMLGVSAVDAEGNVRPVIDVMGDLADRFSKMPNGAEKTALAMRVFGRAGADMIPMLNEGRDGLQEMYVEAERLGIVLDTETAKSAEALGDQLTKLNRAKDGVITKITSGMLPALSSLSRSFTVASVNGDGLQTVGRALGRVMNGLIGVFVGITGVIMAAGLNFVAFAKTMERVIHLDFAGAAQAWAAGTGRARASISGTVAQIGALLKTVEGGSAVVPELTEDTEDLASANRRATRQARELSDEQKALNELMEEGRRTFEQTRTPAEIYTAQLEEYNRQLRVGAINQDTFNRAIMNARQAFESSDPSTQMWRDTSRAVQEAAYEMRRDRREAAAELATDLREDLYDSTYDGVRGGLEAAADGNLGQYLASRIREALFDNLASSITDLLRGSRDGKSGGGGAFGWLNAVGSVLKSFAGGLPGFKTGGSFKVGGSGGADSQLMAFRATPGEMVDIRRPGQDSGSGAMAVHVVPSPYFDVQVEKVATPIAGRAGVQSFGAARSQVPADAARRQRFNLAGAR